MKPPPIESVQSVFEERDALKAENAKLRALLVETLETQTLTEACRKDLAASVLT